MNRDEKLTASGSVVSITIDGIESFELELQSRNDRYISSEIKSTGIWEAFETSLFCTICNPGDIVIDVGANIGWYTIIASRLVGRQGKVIAFEPEPSNFEILQRNVERSALSNVVTYNYALADIPGNQELYLSDDNLGDHRLFKGDEVRDKVNTKVSTLDHVIKRHDMFPTILKSDTQGSEALILQGGQEVLFGSGQRPTLLIEFWPYGLFESNSDPIAMANMLCSLGYRIFEVSEANPKLIETNVYNLGYRVANDLSPETGNFINLLAIDSNSLLMNKIESTQLLKE